MFETLLQLPLFQGFSVEQLTQLIETVGLDFQKYDQDKVIHSKGDEYKHLCLLVSGSVRLSTSYFEGTFILHETLTAPHIILPNFFYGWHTTSPATIIAREDVGIIQFSKSVFESVASTFPIFLINYLNILSFRAQHAHMISQVMPASLEKRMYSCIEMLAHRGSSNIIIETPRANFADALGVPRMAFYNMLEEIQKEGKINLSRGKIELL